MDEELKEFTQHSRMLFTGIAMVGYYVGRRTEGVHSTQSDAGSQALLWSGTALDEELKEFTQHSRMLFTGIAMGGYYVGRRTEGVHSTQSDAVHRHCYGRVLRWTKN